MDYGSYAPMAPMHLVNQIRALPAQLFACFQGGHAALVVYGSPGQPAERRVTASGTVHGKGGHHKQFEWCLVCEHDSAKTKNEPNQEVQMMVRPCPSVPLTKIAQGWPKLWANVKALVGIYSQNVGPSLAIWANPVQF